MSSDNKWLSDLRAERAVAVLRADNADLAYDAACAILEGGIRAIEVTMTVPAADRVIERLVDVESALVGAGTVLTADEVDRCIDKGARFIFSPACCPDVVARAKERGVPVIPGAMTPTEILEAWRSGADMVKVFPAARLGPAYLSDIRGPLPDIPLVPTGGITDENAREYLDAGAALLCLGSWLADRALMNAGRFDQITERARAIRRILDEYGDSSDG